MSVALVTGASAGIGRAFAVGLAARGHDVVLVARDGDAARGARGRSSTRAHGVAAEVLAADLSPIRRSSRRSRPALADVDAPVDMLVNNAGFGTYGRFAELDVDARGATRSSSTSSRSCASRTPRSARWRRAAAARSSTSSSLAGVPADTRQRDLRRDQGVRAQLHPLGARRARGAPA